MRTEKSENRLYFHIVIPVNEILFNCFSKDESKVVTVTSMRLLHPIAPQKLVLRLSAKPCVAVPKAERIDAKRE